MEETKHSCVLLESAEVQAMLVPFIPEAFTPPGYPSKGLTGILRDSLIPANPPLSPPPPPPSFVRLSPQPLSLPPPECHFRRLLIGRTAVVASSLAGSRWGGARRSGRSQRSNARFEHELAGKRLSGCGASPPLLPLAALRRPRQEGADEARSAQTLR